jgi:hypothetical protein
MCDGNIEKNLSRSESKSFAELVYLCSEIAEMFEDEEYHKLVKFSMDDNY